MSFSCHLDPAASEILPLLDRQGLQLEELPVWVVSNITISRQTQLAESRGRCVEHVDGSCPMIAHNCTRLLEHAHCLAKAFGTHVYEDVPPSEIGIKRR